MDSPLPVLRDISSIFPDIEGQLCSRHSILFGKLKNTFNKIYDNMDPSNYTMVKGVLDLFADNDICLSMGLQNGIILMSRQIDQASPIYINSNHSDEELIFTCDGKLEEGLSSYQDQISLAIEAANHGLQRQKLCGAIFYMHSNIPEDCFYYKEIMLISIFIGVSLINNTLQKQSTNQLIQKLAKCQIFGDENFLNKIFKFTNRNFSLTVADVQYRIPLQQQNKMVILQLDVAKQDIRFQKQRKQQLLNRKHQILKQCRQICGLDSILQIYSANDLPSLNFDNQISYDDQIMNADRFLYTSIEELKLLSAFNDRNINFEQLVSAQWELNSKHWRLHSEEVVELLQEIKSTLKLNSCMIINESFALIVADKSTYTQLLVFLRQKLHKGELKSKSLFKIQQQLVQSRWGSDKHIGQKMFTSVPSCGVSVFDPSQAIWFD